MAGGFVWFCGWAWFGACGEIWDVGGDEARPARLGRCEIFCSGGDVAWTNVLWADAVLSGCFWPGVWLALAESEKAKGIPVRAIDCIGFLYFGYIKAGYIDLFSRELT